MKKSLESHGKKQGERQLNKNYDPQTGELVSNADPSNPTIRRDKQGGLISRDPAPKIERGEREIAVPIPSRESVTSRASDGQNRASAAHSNTGMSHRVLPGSRSPGRYEKE